MKKQFMLMSALGEAPAGGAPPVEPAPPAASLAPELGEGREWLAGVDAEYISDPSLQAIQDVPALVKSYINAQKMVGKDKAVIPDGNSSEEDWTNFYRKAGLPDTMEGYELTSPEGMYTDEQSAAIKQLAFDNNIMPAQMAKILEMQNDYRVEASTHSDDDDKALVAEGIQELKDEWGEEGYNANISKAQTVIDEFGGDDMMAYIEESGLGDDPMLIRLLAKIGENLTEDTFQQDAIGHLGVSKEDAENEVAKIFGDDTSPYWNANHANHDRVVQRMAKLNEILSK